MLLDKIPRKTKINSGSDKRFESISLFIEQLPLQIQFTKGKENTENELRGINWL